MCFKSNSNIKFYFNNPNVVNFYWTDRSIHFKLG